MAEERRVDRQGSGEQQEPGGMMMGRRRMMMGDDERARDMRGTARRLIGYMRRYRRTLIGVVGLVVVTTGLEVAGPYLMGRAIDEYIASNDLPGLFQIALLMAGVYVAVALTSWLQSFVMARVSQNAVRDLRQDLFNRLQVLPLRFFDRRASGDLMSRVTNDVDNISSVLSESVTQLISSVLTLVGVSAMMLWLDLPLALISLLTFPLMTSLTAQVAKRARRGFREQQAALGALNGMVEETIAAEQVVKAYGREQASIEAFEKFNNRLEVCRYACAVFRDTDAASDLFCEQYGPGDCGFCRWLYGGSRRCDNRCDCRFYQLCAAVRTAFGAGRQFVQFDTVGTGRGGAGF